MKNLFLIVCSALFAALSAGAANTAPFDIEGFFPLADDSCWYYVGHPLPPTNEPATIEDNFLWTILNERKTGLPFGDPAYQFHTLTDESTDDRNQSRDWYTLFDPNPATPNETRDFAGVTYLDGDLLFHGFHQGPTAELFDEQDIVLNRPLIVARRGMNVGFTNTSSATASVDIDMSTIPPSLLPDGVALNESGIRTVTGTLTAEITLESCLASLDTPLGTFSDVLVLRVKFTLSGTIEDVKLIVGGFFPTTQDIDFDEDLRDNRFYLKQGVGMIAQDQAEDTNDAHQQALSRGKVGGVDIVADSNQPTLPVANADAFTTPVDTSVDCPVLVNDSPAEVINGTRDLIRIVTLPTKGTIAGVSPTDLAPALNVAATGVTYTPGTGAEGVDTFTYFYVDDNGARSNDATVTITIGETTGPAVLAIHGQMPAPTSPESPTQMDEGSTNGFSALVEAEAGVKSVDWTQRGQSVRMFALNGTDNVLITEVDPATDRIELFNAGTDTVDVSNWWVCSQFSYAEIGTLTVESGALALGPGQVVVISGFALADLKADLGLYRVGGSFASAGAMADFVQWSNDDNSPNGRESVAVTKGIWDAGTRLSPPAAGKVLSRRDPLLTKLIAWVNDVGPNLDRLSFSHVFTPGFGFVESAAARVDRATSADATLTVSITDADDQSASVDWPLTVNDVDRLPPAPTISVIPAAPTTGNDLTVLIDFQGDDPDGDAITYGFAWQQVTDAGVSVGDPVVGNPLLAANTQKGQIWRAIVTPLTDPYGDGPVSGNSATSADLTIGNTLPVIDAISITHTLAEPRRGSVLGVSLSTSDADGDTVTPTNYKWEQFGNVLADGIAVGSDSLSNASGNLFRKGGAVSVTVTVSDGNGGSAIGVATLTIVNTPPVVESTGVTFTDQGRVTAVFSAVPTGSDEDLNAAGVEESVSFSYEWLVDGAPTGVVDTDLANDLSARAIYFVKGDKVNVRIIATDGEANTEVTGSDIPVQDTPPAEPVAGSISPERPDSADNLTVVGSVAGLDVDTADSVQVEYRWSRASDFTSGVHVADPLANGLTMYGERWYAQARSEADGASSDWVDVGNVLVAAWQQVDLDDVWSARSLYVDPSTLPDSESGFKLFSDLFSEASRRGLVYGRDRFTPFSRLEPLQGMWILPNRLGPSTVHVPGMPLVTAARESVSLPLDIGFNFIGPPQDLNLPIDDLVTNGTLNGSIWEFDSQRRRYKKVEGVGVFEKGKAYFINVDATDPAQPVSITFPLESTLGSISGTVAGDQVAGVTITLSGDATRTTTSAVDGSYSFANLSPGTYNIAADTTGFAFLPANYLLVVDAAETLDHTAVNFDGQTGSREIVDIDGDAGGSIAVGGENGGEVTIAAGLFTNDVGGSRSIGVAVFDDIPGGLADDQVQVSTAMAVTVPFDAFTENDGIADLFDWNLSGNAVDNVDADLAVGLVRVRVYDPANPEVSFEQDYYVDLVEGAGRGYEEEYRIIFERNWKGDWVPKRHCCQKVIRYVPEPDPEDEEPQEEEPQEEEADRPNIDSVTTTRTIPNAVVEVISTVVVQAGAYLEIDVSGGPGAASYPVTPLTSVPSSVPSSYKTTKIILRRIRPGSFRMGADGDFAPPGEDGHRVTLTKGFHIGIFEITQQQWNLVMGTNPSHFSDKPTHPVETVSYVDVRGAQDVAPWPASYAVDPNSFMGKLRAKTGLNFDLPSESQWEYACRAGTKTSLNNGTNVVNYFSADLNADVVGWHARNARDGYWDDSFDLPSREGTQPVGRKSRNAWGLYDMHGNVTEWCLDWFIQNLGSGTKVDPAGGTTPTIRMTRGGGWEHEASHIRSSSRLLCFPPGHKGYWNGFRLSLYDNLPAQ